MNTRHYRKRLAALVLCMSLPASGWTQFRAGSMKLSPQGSSGRVSGRIPHGFLKSLENHLDTVGAKLTTSIPLVQAPGVKEAAVAEYLSRAALGPWGYDAAAARIAARTLGDPELRAGLVDALRATGSPQAKSVAAKLESAAVAVKEGTLISNLGEDLSRGLKGATAGEMLSQVFDGMSAVKNGVGVVGPEDFAEYALRRFSGGRTAGNLAVVASDAVLAGGRLNAVADDDQLQSRMELSPLTNAEREQLVTELFEEAGASPANIRRQEVGGGRSNVIVVKKGRTDRVVVVGGHYDKVHEGHGTIDNWTGVTLVVNLYQAMKDIDTEATYVFIGFAREEDGLVGAREYVRSLSRAERGKIDSMINLDTLGVDGTFSWENNSDKPLLDMILKTAEEKGFDHTPMRLWGGDADSSVFRRVGVPAMTILGASNDVIWDIIHSKNDNIAAFSLPHYKNAYLLTLALLRRLDGEPVRRGFIANLVSGVLRWFSGIGSPLIHQYEHAPRGSHVYYSGTSLDDIESILFGSGGDMKPGLSYFAVNYAVSENFARSRAKARGAEGFVLEFQGQPVSDRIDFHLMEGFSAYFEALTSVPLALMTPASKTALMAALERRWKFLPDDRAAARRAKALAVLHKDVPDLDEPLRSERSSLSYAHPGLWK